MRSQDHSRTLYAALAGLFIWLGAAITAVSAAEIGAVTLSPIHGRQEEDLQPRFDRNALPSGSSDAGFQNGEMFRLSSPDKPSLIVAPIQFDTLTHDAGSNMRFDCGAFLLDADGHRSFSRTTAADSPLDCMGLAALAAMPHDGSRPRLLFLYYMSDRRGRDRSEIDVLVWSAAQHSYEVDRLLSRWLTTRLPRPTIAKVRRLLATRSQARAK
jgi:hypothetical protein